jgi:hypothetical protein
MKKCFLKIRWRNPEVLVRARAKRKIGDNPRRRIKSPVTKMMPEREIVMHGKKWLINAPRTSFGSL